MESLISQVCRGSDRQKLLVSLHTWNKQHGTSASTVTDQVVDDISKGPNKWNSEEGDAEQNDVQDNSQEEVGEPYSPAVHHPGVGVHLAVSHAHIHAEQRETSC